MTVIPCFYCEKSVDTKNETLMVTVNWIYEDLLKLNNINSGKDASRIVNICSECWDNVFKKKPEIENWYWVHNKDV